MYISTFVNKFDQLLGMHTLENFKPLTLCIFCEYQLDADVFEDLKELNMHSVN